LVKRAKEFNSEFDQDIRRFPDAKFMVIFKIPPHELDKKGKIRQKILEQRTGRTYDAVLFQDELGSVLGKFEEWNVPRRKPA